jgi:hypothetical protein
MVGPVRQELEPYEFVPAGPIDQARKQHRTHAPAPIPGIDDHVLHEPDPAAFRSGHERLTVAMPMICPCATATRTNDVPAGSVNSMLRPFYLFLDVRFEIELNAEKFVEQFAQPGDVLGTGGTNGYFHA